MSFHGIQTGSPRTPGLPTLPVNTPTTPSNDNEMSPVTVIHISPNYSPVTIVRIQSTRGSVCSTISTMSDLPPPAHGKALPLLHSISVPSLSFQLPHHTNTPPWTGEVQGLTRMDPSEVWWQQRLYLPLLPSEGQIWGDLIHGSLPPKVYVDDSAALVEGKMGLKRPEPLLEKGSRSLLRFCLNTDGSCVDMSTPSTSSVPSLESRSVRTAASEIERREYRRPDFTEVMVDGTSERVDERVERDLEEREGMAKGKKQKQKRMKSLRRRI